MQAFAFFLFGFFPCQYAVSQPLLTDVPAFSAVIKDVKKTVGDADVTQEILAEAIEKTKNVLTAGKTSADEIQSELAKVDQSIDLLGLETKNDPPEVARQRKLLLQKKSGLEKKLSEIRLILVNSEDLLADINDRREKLSNRQFFHRRADFLQLMQQLYSRRTDWTGDSISFLSRQSGIETFTHLHLGVGIFLLLISVIFGLWSRWRLVSLALHKKEFMKILMGSVSRYLPFFLPLLVISLYSQLLTKNSQHFTYIGPLSFACVLFVFQLWLVRLFFKPILGENPLIRLPDKLSSSFRSQLRITAFLVSFLSLLLVAPVETEPGASYYYFLRLVTGTALCCVLARLGWLFNKIPGLEKTAFWIRSILTIVLLTAIITELLGFHNISLHVIKGFTKTIALATLFFCVRYVVNSVFTSLSYGKAGWPQKVREQVGLSAKEVGPSFIWMNFLINFLLLLALFVTVLNIWLQSWTVGTQSAEFIMQGFTIGETHIVPLRIAIGLLLFALFWTLSKWVKTRLKKSISQDQHVSKSARDAIVTLSGYLGIIIAVLIGLAMAGVNFTSLAVIAGALSVGIGFGLQNIVSNFISGLILLFEQPIRRGDWIVVGNTEGYVKRISVRSTVITTFDKAEVIVPNSEFISTQVTNWMFSDRNGRLRVPVGVAYGSDTELVKKILEDIAFAHPAVITDGSTPKPAALFMNFGDSSLNFELRLFLTEVDSRFKTLSDINFSIDAAFRKNNIQIPFPQRDIHIMNSSMP
ncbi:MAG: mechanosensitive ion channel domain-containing protein [Pseudomonadota bacterium]